VSLVDQGRCGAACAIKDRSIPVAREVKKPIISQKFMDALKGVLSAKVKDDGDVDTHMKKLDDAVEEMNTPGDVDGDTHTHVTVNLGDGKTTKDEEPDGPGGDDKEMCSKADLDAAVAAAVSGVRTEMQGKIDDLQNQLAAMADDVGSSMDPDDVSTQDAVARAEVLKPGFQMPALDAKPGSKSHRDSLVNVKRRALAESFATRDGRAAIAHVIGNATPDFGKMSPGEVELVFRNASQAMRDAVMSKQADGLLQTATAGIIRDADGNKRVLDSATWGAEIRKHFGRAA
jgi:hypothetical protein